MKTADIEKSFSRLSALCQNYADREALRVLYELALERPKWKIFTIGAGAGGGEVHQLITKENKIP